jgi:hypothetical protein
MVTNITKLSTCKRGLQIQEKGCVDVSQNKERCRKTCCFAYIGANYAQLI